MFIVDFFHHWTEPGWLPSHVSNLYANLIVCPNVSVSFGFLEPNSAGEFL